MKKYWKLAVLVPLIVLGIGTYYTYAATIHYSEYYLKMQAGNAQEAAQLSFHARYRSEALTIRTKGSDYQSKQSFWQSLDSSYYPTKEMKELAQQYPHFMRGKINPKGFYVDDRVIGYAKINSQYHLGRASNFRFNISVYDKKLKNSLSFELNVPNDIAYDFVNLNHVQINGQTMKLFAINSGKNELRSIHLYTIDLDKKNIVADRTIFSTVASDAANANDIFEVNKTDDVKQGTNFIVFQVLHHRISSGGSADPYTANTSTVDSRELLIYDIKNDTLSGITNEALIQLLKNPALFGVSQNGDDLYFTAMDYPNGPRIICYSLTDKKISKDITINRKDFQTNGEYITFHAIANNRLYMLVTPHQNRSQVSEYYKIDIADLNTGKIVYQGLISRKDNQKLGDLQFLFITINNFQFVDSRFHI